MMRRRDLPALLTLALTGCKGSSGSRNLHQPIRRRGCQVRHAIILLLMVSAGCGRQGGPVRIAVIGNGFGHAVPVLTRELGFYEQEGVQVAIEYLPSTAKTVEALLAGSAEFAATGFDHLLNLAVSGKTLRSVVLIVSRDSRSLVVSPARSGIRTIKDLRGHSIGVPGLGSSNHMFVQHVLAKHGLNWADASFAAISMGRPAVLAVERGAVDAAVLTVADIAMVRKRYPNLTILSETLTPEGHKAVWNAASIPFILLAAKPDWIEQNRDKARRVAKAVRRTLLWLQAHSAEEIRAALPPEFVTDDAALDVEVLRIFKMLYSADGVMPEHGPETLRKALSLAQTDLRAANIDLSELYTNEFVTERP